MAADSTTTKIYNANTATSSTPTTITFTYPARHLVLLAKTTPCFVNLTGNTASTSDFELAVGVAVHVDLRVELPTISVVTAASAGSISVIAHSV